MLQHISSSKFTPFVLSYRASPKDENMCEHCLYIIGVDALFCFKNHWVDRNLQPCYILIFCCGTKTPLLKQTKGEVYLAQNFRLHGREVTEAGTWEKWFLYIQSRSESREPCTLAYAQLALLIEFLFREWSFPRLVLYQSAQLRWSLTDLLRG